MAVLWGKVALAEGVCIVLAACASVRSAADGVIVHDGDRARGRQRGCLGASWWCGACSGRRRGLEEVCKGEARRRPCVHHGTSCGRIDMSRTMGVVLSGVLGASSWLGQDAGVLSAERGSRRT